MFLSDILTTTPVTKFVQFPKRTYDRVNIKGVVAFDGLHLRNKELTNQEVLDIVTEETFGSFTIFLANFEDTLAAGNYASVNDPIVKWKVMRRPVSSFAPILLNELGADQTTYVDYTQANHKNYEYQVIPITTTGKEGSPLTSIAQSDFYGWFLTDEDSTKIYKFDMEIESESIALNVDIKLFEGYSQFPIQRTGKRKYRTGGLSTIPYTYNGASVHFTSDTLREIEAFISDGTTKILKNTSGDLFRVQTSDFSYKYMDNVQVQPYTISFKWTQVGDVD